MKNTETIDKIFKVVISDDLEELEEIDDLQNELPELQPRFVVYSCR